MAPEEGYKADFLLPQEFAHTQTYTKHIYPYTQNLKKKKKDDCAI